MLLITEVDAFTIACLSFPLHLTLAENSTSLSLGQPRLGVPEVRTIRRIDADQMIHEANQLRSMA